MSNLEVRRRSYAEVRDVLFSAFQARRPGSLIRIGDGESVILDYQPNSPSQDLAYHLRLWFGNSAPMTNQLQVLRNRLRAACRSATVLGIPTLRQCKLHPRYQASYQCLERLLQRQHNLTITDCAVHRFLHLSGDLLACFKGSPFIGLVTSQPVADLVCRHFMPDELFFKRLPKEHSDQSDSLDPEPMSWLDDRGLLRDFQVRPPYRGAPYFVGAGLMGKLLCDQIRRSGGFAVDLGSIFDGWVDNTSRAYFANYPPGSYRLEHALPLSSLGSQQRLQHFLALADSNESAPESFCLK